jgi:hypothetical protein
MAPGGRLPHDLVRDREVAYPQFIDHVRRHIRFDEHQPHEVRVVAIVCCAADTEVQSVVFTMVFPQQVGACGPG